MTPLYSKSKRKYHIYLFVLVAFLLQITLASIMPLAYADENLGTANEVTEIGTENEGPAALIGESPEGGDISDGGTDSGNGDINAGEPGAGEEPEGGDGEIIGDPDDGEPDDGISDGVEEPDDGAKKEAEDEQDSEGGDVEEEAKDEQDDEEDAVEEKPQPMIKSMQLLGGRAGEDLDDIFTVVGLWKGKIEGDGPIEDLIKNLEVIEENQPVELDEDTTITMKYDWDIRGLDVKPGDTVSIKIPDIFVTAGSYPEQPLLLNNGTNVGTWTISEGILQLTFGDALGDNIDPNLLTDTFIVFGFTLKMEEFEEDITYEIEFNDSADKTFNLVIKPSSFAESITKIGLPDGPEENGKKDARNITWTIDVLNTEETALVGAILSETAIPEGLSLDISSFTQTPLTMGYDGVGYPKETTEGILDPSKNGGFEIQLPEIAPYGGYRIEYTTTITDFSITEFTNEAGLYKEGEVKPLTATDTVANLTRSAPLEKSGKAEGEHEIKWTIYVNKGGISITQPIVKDTLPIGLAIKEIDGEKQITVYKCDSDDDCEPVQEVDIFGFPNGLELPEIGTDDIYKIEYITTIDYTQVNEGTYKEENLFTNGATLSDGENQIGDPVEATVKITRARLLSKDGSGPAEYGDTLTWTIMVNSAYHTITGATLYDIIPENLIFNKGNVEISKREKGGNWVKLEDEAKPTVSDMDTTSRIVTIDLDDITEEYKITYTTQITGDGFKDGHEFENKAWLEGDKTGTGIGTSVSNPVKKSLEPPDNSYGKKHIDIDYDNKIITWQIEIDPIKEPITELKIVDTFPNKGLVLLPDTLVIKRGTKVMDSSTYTLSQNIEGGITGYQKGFILEFTDGTSENPILGGEKMTITYDTSYDPQGVTIDGKTYTPDPYEGPTDKDQRAYINEAAITGKTKSGKTISKEGVNATALTGGKTDDPSWLSGKKEGRRIYIDDNDEIVTDWISGKDRLIEWKIYINYLKQDLGSGVTVTDTIQYDGQIHLDSVEIREYSVNSGTGETTIGDPLASTNYNKNLSDDERTLTITFTEAVTERYVIIYRTTVPGESQKIYTNSAIVTTNGEDYPYGASVRYGEYDRFIDKKALVEGDTVYTDDEIEWEIVINENLSTDMTDVVITDTIASGMAFKSGSLKIYRVENGAEAIVVDGENEENEEYEIQTTGDHNSGTTLIIEFNNPINHKYIVRYKTIIIATSGQISNSAEIKGIYTEDGKISGKSYSAKKFGYTGGTILLDRGKICIKKVDKNGTIITNNPAEFKLWYDLNDLLVPFNEGEIFSTGNNGFIEIHSLPLREYQLEEVTAPEGFEKLENKIVFDVTKPFLDDTDNVKPVPVKNEKIKVEITGIKEWERGPTQGRPDITLQLFRRSYDMTDEKELIDEQELSDEPWSYTWTVDKTDNEGNEYTYTVDEANVPKNYEKKGITKTETEYGFSFTITNTYVSPKINITGEKIWERGPSTRPSIELQLYRDGEAYGDIVTLDGEEETPWTYTWDELDETDFDGNPYTYTIDEVKVPARYRNSISKDGLTITNRYRPSEGGGAEPEDPKDPTEPTVPENPEDPEDPTDPKDPTEPEDPTIPEDPEDSEKPTETPKYEYPEVPDPNDSDSPDEFILIEKEGAPLGTYTKHQKDDGTFIYVDENKVSLGSESAPKTGDRMPILLMIIIHILSLGTALYLIKHKNKLYN